MKTIQNYLQTASVSLMLLSFTLQSCAVYHQTPSTIEEAAAPGNLKTKITTNDGKKHILNWFEIKDEHIEYILYTKKEAFRANKVQHILNLADSSFIFLGSVSHLRGSYYMKTNYNEGPYFDIYRDDDWFYAAKITRKDTSTTIIIRDQIQKIQMYDKKGSDGLKLAAVIGGSVTGIFYLIYKQVESDGFGLGGMKL